MAVEVHPQFVVDAEGKTQSVLLSVTEFEALMQELEDYADSALIYEMSLTAKPEDFVPLEEVEANLRAAGKL